MQCPHPFLPGDGVYVLTNAKDQTAKLWDLRKMLTGVTDCRRLGFGANPTWDYRFMDYYVSCLLSPAVSTPIGFAMHLCVCARARVFFLRACAAMGQASAAPA